MVDPEIHLGEPNNVVESHQCLVECGEFNAKFNGRPFPWDTPLDLPLKMYITKAVFSTLTKNTSSMIM